jgi:hypothetical protein
MKTVTLTLWDGTQKVFTDPAVWRIKPDGLLWVGQSEGDCFAFPFTSIKVIETVTAA